MTNAMNFYEYTSPPSLLRAGTTMFPRSLLAAVQVWSSATSDATVLQAKRSSSSLLVPAARAVQISRAAALPWRR